MLLLHHRTVSACDGWSLAAHPTSQFSVHPLTQPSPRCLAPPQPPSLQPSSGTFQRGARRGPPRARAPQSSWRTTSESRCCVASCQADPEDPRGPLLCLACGARTALWALPVERSRVGRCRLCASRASCSEKLPSFRHSVIPALRSSLGAPHDGQGLGSRGRRVRLALVPACVRRA